MCEKEDLERLFSQSTYKHQLLNLAILANNLSLNSIKLYSNTINKNELLENMASVELLIAEFKAHFTEWDKVISEIKKNIVERSVMCQL